MFTLFHELIQQQVLDPLNEYQQIGIKIGIAIIYIIAGFIVGFFSKVIVLWIMRKFGINKLLRRFFDNDIYIGKERVDRVAGRSISWFIFLVFLRRAVQYLEFQDVENFLETLINYLPKVFLAILVAFFGIRFSGTIHSVVYNSLRYYDEQISKILAYIAQGIIWFFTTIVVLDYIAIIDQFIIRTFVVSVIGSLAIAFWLAFWLGGKEFAAKALERITHKPEKDLLNTKGNLKSKKK